MCVLPRWVVLHVSLGPGRVIRNMLGCHSWRKQIGLGHGCSVVPSAQQETGERRDRTTQLGRSLVIPRALVRTRTGEAPLSGHVLESGDGHC